MLFNTKFDAIVVGSGMSGGWAAKELTENGLKVLVIERGRMVEHVKDYVGEHKNIWDFKFRNLPDRKLYDEEYPIQKKATPSTKPHVFSGTTTKKPLCG
jgi:choline dehydrogenase-like flavoprotein